MTESFISDEQLDRLLKLYEATTSGPWKSFVEGRDHLSGSNFIRTGGEDFELLFTLKEAQVEKLKTEFDDFSVIGKMSNEFNQLRLNTGEDRTIQFDL